MKEFTEKELVSFANYVLDNLRSNLDGVTDATLQNWKHDNRKVCQNDFNVAGAMLEMAKWCRENSHLFLAGSWLKDEEPSSNNSFENGDRIYPNEDHTYPVKPDSTKMYFEVNIDCEDDLPEPGDVCLFTDGVSLSVPGIYDHSFRRAFARHADYFRKGDETKYPKVQVLIKEKDLGKPGFNTIKDAIDFLRDNMPPKEKF